MSGPAQSLQDSGDECRSLSIDTIRGIDDDQSTYKGRVFHGEDRRDGTAD
jgi:hypothetical protein